MRLKGNSQYAVRILFLVAEYMIRKKFYVTRHKWFVVIDVLPLIVDKTNKKEIMALTMIGE